MMTLISGSPTLQALTSTSNVAGVQELMLELLRLIAQIAFVVVLHCPKAGWAPPDKRRARLAAIGNQRRTLNFEKSADINDSKIMP